MSRRGTEINPLHWGRSAQIGLVVILITVVVVSVFFLIPPATPARYNQSGIQFYKDGEPVGDPVFGQGLLGGSWTYAGQEVDAAEFKIVWQADVPEDYYVDVTLRYGVQTATGGYPHVSTKTHQPRAAEFTLTYNLNNIDASGFVDGDTIIFGGAVEFALYTADGELVNSAGDRIEVTLVYQSEGSGYTGEFLIASITITPYLYEPPIIEPFLVVNDATE